MDSTAISTSSSGQYKWCGLGNSTFVNALIDASRNQGKYSKAKNRSLPPIRSQKPCEDTLVTSTCEMRFPSFADVIFALPNYSGKEGSGLVDWRETLLIANTRGGVRVPGEWPNACKPKRLL